jgi:predicted GTPase
MLEHLESVPVQRQTAQEELRFPIQIVLRPDATFRGFAGQLASGRIRPGDEVLALPSGQKSRVKRIVAYEGDQEEAAAPQPVTVQLEDEIDLSRGDALVSPQHRPAVSRHFSAMVVWLQGQRMEPGREYLLKHTTRQVRARAVRILHRVNVNTLEKEQAGELHMNDIALVEFSANLPLYFDPYRKNRTTGSFILIDPLSNATIGAGMIQEDFSARAERETSAERVREVWTGQGVSFAERHARHGHLPALLIYRGNPQFARRAERVLFDEGFEAFHVAGNAVPRGNASDAVKALLEAGLIVLVSAEDLGEAVIADLKAASHLEVHELEPAASAGNDKVQLEGVLRVAQSLRISEPRFSGTKEEIQ